MRALEMRKSLVRIPSPAGTTRYARIFSLPNSIERSIRTQDFSKDPGGLPFDSSSKDLLYKF